MKYSELKVSGQPQKEGNPASSVLDHEVLKYSFVSPFGVKQRLRELRLISSHIKNELPWLILALECLDFTTLAGDDTPVNVRNLCRKASHPLSSFATHKWMNDLHWKRVAAVCVYPQRVPDAVQFFKECSIKNVGVASVATGFPTGQYPLESRLLEIKYAVEQGATEIDVVISRCLVLTDQWDALYHEISEMKKACGDAHMKTILAVGECDSYENIYKASLIAALAGSDFIKTSTGKETVNATLDVGIIMCRAIRTIYEVTGKKIGFKPAGGIKTSKDAIEWLSLVKCELGDEWLNPSLFRIGASSVLDDIVTSIIHRARPPAVEII
nr:PREDICTED: deoxyribose-phosphate aldolase [Bemisia tabaci]XP_018897890.1 PREDICTED: deoxyribose-phosphate aldolase [Bemisia tabaci]XP_018897891.1 PREDICTED: deoxyribose-phosphate aldolase [Bemisia tabaci]